MTQPNTGQPGTPPPYPPPPAQPPKKKHRGLKIVGGIVGALAVIGIISAAVGGGDSKQPAADQQQGSATSSVTKAAKSAATSKAAPSASVGKGFGSKDASGDVKLGKPTTNGYWVTIPVTVTNHSSKRSDYFIDVSLESADGKTQFDTGSAIAQRVEPGQSAVAEVMLTKVKEAPVGAKPSLKSVQRSPSL